MTAGTTGLPYKPSIDWETRPVASRSPARLAWTRFKRSKLGVLGMALVLGMTLVGIFAPVIAPYDPNKMDLGQIKADPSRDHLLGTDALGQDEFSRLIYGARLSLAIGVASALIATVVGIVVGAVSGYYGGWIEGALMRFVDLMLAFPSIFLLLIIASILEGISIGGIVLFFGFFNWMWLSRIIRGEFLSLKRREFTEAARSIGVPGHQIVLRHLLPNVIGPIIVTFTLDIALFMLTEAGLSFLGFGVPPERPTWGNMLQQARTDYLTHPILAIAPGLALTGAVLAFNFIGDGLRDAFDPKGRLS
jgi:peptide/nickel transport system permease protein